MVEVKNRMAMFENISEFFKRFMQNDKKELLAENPTSQSKDTAKDRCTNNMTHLLFLYVSFILRCKYKCKY